MLPFPSIDTLARALTVCLKQEGPRLYSASLHSCIRNRGVHVHLSLGNNLVFFLAKSGNLCSAQSVFDSLEHTNPSSWASLVDGYVGSSNSVLALGLYQKMPYESPPLDPYSFVYLLKACAELQDLKTGSRLHLHAATLRLLETSSYVGTALVDMYAKCGALSEATEVFQSLPIRSTVVCNALLAGYVLHQHFKEAMDLFNHMKTQGIPPDFVTFSCILKACASLGAADKGSEVHSAIKGMGILQENEFVGNALVSMYSKCGLHTHAKEVLMMLPSRSVVSWNALMTGYMQHNCPQEVLMCYEQMQLDGIRADDVTYVCVLQACGSIAARDKGIAVHADTRRRGTIAKNLLVGTALVDMYAKCGMLAEAQKAFNKLPAHDVVAWSALIAGYTQHQRGEEALNCFDFMQSKGVPPNAITYACSLKACGIIGAIEKGGKIHDTIEQKGFLKTDLALGNAVVDMYAKCGEPAKAFEVLEQLPSRNVISWTSIISGYAQLGEASNVFVLLQRMREEGIFPNQITFLSALHACSHAGSVDDAQTLFEAMTQQFGIIPALQHLTCGIGLLRRAGQFDEATEIMSRTPSQFDIVACFAILGACKKWGNITLERRASDLAMQLDVRRDSSSCLHP